MQEKCLIERIEKLLLEDDFNWLSLDQFDDKTYNEYSDEEWLEKARLNSCLLLQSKAQEIQKERQIFENQRKLALKNSKSFGKTQSKVLDDEFEEAGNTQLKVLSKQGSK